MKVLDSLTPQNYLGKDDFWHVGDRAAIDRRRAGLLFGQLCFPVRGYVETVMIGTGRNIAAVALSHDAIGLDVKSRDEVGMPEFVGSIGSPYPTGRQLLHEKTFGTDLTPATAVIQAAGIIALSRNKALVEDICSKCVRTNALPAFVGSLEELIGA